MIETIEDVIEDLANMYGFYGAHDDVECEKRPCRCCWVSRLRARIEAAVEIERKLSK